MMFCKQLFIVCALLCLNVSSFALEESFSIQDKTITDEVVQNLSCHQLSLEAILTNMRVHGAFAKSRHLPVRNWGWMNGPYELGSCWSLSRFQRLAFYLGRKELFSTPQNTRSTLDLMRGASPKTIFPWNSQAVQDWQRGYRQVIPNAGEFERNLKSDINQYQAKRFHDLRNLALIDGPRARPQKINRKSFSLIQENTQLSYLTLIILRFERHNQHAVVVKSVSTALDGRKELIIYDSNYPDRDLVVFYDETEAQFYAPASERSFVSKPDPALPVGVFVVDEAERDVVLRTLLKHYQKICRSL